MNEDKKEVKKELGADDLAKQLKNIAFTVRKMKDWLEEKLGADIDGDGRIGGGPFKKVLVLLVSLTVASMCFGLPANTNITVWKGPEANPVSCVHNDGGIKAPYFSGNILSANGNGLAWTNGTAACTPVLMTNITTTSSNVVAYLAVTSTNVTVTVPVTSTNMVASETLTMTNMTATVPVTSTNILASITLTTSNLVYLDASSNVCTQTVVIAVSQNTSAIGSAGTPILASVVGNVTPNTSAIGSAGTPVLATIGSAGTPSINAVVGGVTRQTVTPTITITPATGSFIKP